MREAMATASALGVELPHLAVQERDRIAWSSRRASATTTAAYPWGAPGIVQFLSRDHAQDLIRLLGTMERPC
jgi:hypothetical protein